MNPIEKRATIALASIFSIRMLGLFMVLPIFSIYAVHLSHATPLLIGVAIGIYGLTQAIMQIPFGMLSDYFPRKKIIAIGLCLFILGSIVAALSKSIEGVIFGRALQGSGAIGSVIIALLTDLTRIEQRSKSLAIIGMMIGFSFLLSMLLGPLLGNWFHLNGLFWLTALLGCLSLLILYQIVPTSPYASFPPQQSLKNIAELFFHPELWRLNLGIFNLHLILTACFVVLPIIVSHLLKQQYSWSLYFLTLLISCSLTFPLLSYAEKHQRLKQTFVGAITCLTVTLFWLWLFHNHLYEIVIGLIFFFTAFNFLEANLPSLISRAAPPDRKGTAIGIYSSSQFLGIFCGGILGGWIYGHFAPATIFIVCGIIAGLWCLAAYSMGNYVSMRKQPINKQQTAELHED